MKSDSSSAFSTARTDRALKTQAVSCRTPSETKRTLSSCLSLLMLTPLFLLCSQPLCLGTPPRQPRLVGPLTESSKGCSRNYPRGARFFFQTPPTPRTHMESEPPRPPGHVSALINPPHYGSNMPWPPGQVTPPPPHPSDTLSTKHPPPPDTKVFAAPQDNFWHSPNWQGVNQVL